MPEDSQVDPPIYGPQGAHSRRAVGATLAWRALGGLPLLLVSASLLPN